ncbi:hypothetical protein ELQ87_36195 [Streptomyces griseoviridis]|uniref:Uncharacterized protein n=1 Tax=Streptomyces griseoviridis TaxID=45398 RepID=A0A3S9ZN17_STRGD|nr:hypothetical protein ELQ87_36195 [Streptomyces griseoviridis]QCN84072.1 hypothetical protein DDJ31_03045 [Streptomyces griseoviridis]
MTSRTGSAGANRPASPSSPTPDRSPAGACLDLTDGARARLGGGLDPAAGHLAVTRPVLGRRARARRVRRAGGPAGCGRCCRRSSRGAGVAPPAPPGRGQGSG